MISFLKRLLWGEPERTDRFVFTGRVPPREGLVDGDMWLRESDYKLHTRKGNKWIEVKNYNGTT